MLPGTATLETILTGKTPPIFFDDDLGAWVVSKYSDVAAALMDKRLCPATPLTNEALHNEAAQYDETAHRRFREHALASMTGGWLGPWLHAVRAAAVHRLSALPKGERIDLLGDFLAPWSADGAIRAVEADLRHSPEVESMTALALDIAAAAAEPYDEALRKTAAAATVTLSGYFTGAPVMHMQMFIALCSSLPGFLANAWLSLFQNASTPRILRRRTDLIPAAIEELLRLAGPSQILFRRASCDLTIGGASAVRNSLVLLISSAANSDPDQFSEPRVLRLDRTRSRHLAFGDGRHHCIGAGMIRAAGCAATEALLSSGKEVQILGQPA